MIVVGAGRIGTALKIGADVHGVAMTLVDRATGWEALDGPEGDPIVLAVRNDDLRDVLDRIPPSRRADLVFVQNGAIREFLRDRALVGATRGLLYVLAAQRGTLAVSGGTNVLCGPRAEATARWFVQLGLASEAVDRSRFSEFELQKLLWLACNGLLCEVHGVPVGEVAIRHRPQLDALVRELAPVGKVAWGAEPDLDWLVEASVAYSLAIPEYRASVKEWPWRNGWLRAQALRHGIATPLHDALLARTGHPR